MITPYSTASDTWHHIRVTAILGTVLLLILLCSTLQKIRPERTRPATIYAQETTAKMRYSTAQVVQGVVLPPRTSNYFRCPSNTQPTQLMSDTLKDSINIYVWGYEFSGNETVNSILGKQGNDFWDGQYFISQAYVVRDRDNEEFDQTNLLYGNRWYFVTSTDPLYFKCAEGLRRQAVSGSGSGTVATPEAMTGTTTVL